MICYRMIFRVLYWGLISFSFNILVVDNWKRK